MRAVRIAKNLVRRAQGIIRQMSIYFPYRSSPVPGERYFCQNSGSCGSKYIAALFEANNLGPAYHEKEPDLDDFGIDYYEGRVSDRHARAVLLQTRRDVFFEANNRLFAMSRVIQDAFPDARFIHLHRDPRDYLPSALSKPTTLTWESGRKRYTSEALCGPPDATIIEKACTYWTTYNRRIHEDLKGLDHISLKSADLFAGDLGRLEHFIGRRLTIRRLPPVNADKPVRSEGAYPPFDSWSPEDQAIVHRICGALMAELGYGERVEGSYGAENVGSIRLEAGADSGAESP